MILICKREIQIKLCNNFFNRLKGLMFQKNFNYGLCFPHCNSIHTFFMKDNIDVIMTNKENKVLHIYNNLKPNRIILPKKNVYYIYEIPKHLNTYNIGDSIITVK